VNTLDGGDGLDLFFAVLGKKKDKLTGVTADEMIVDI